ncbi:MAG TPA: ELM1/GtrOC1 family putative glycosyltransferase [Candidatus Limnocylindrales bacterium]|nr:ELM1/GtrOC1 family putative glycosyltransferase [Candidatus Limnocylindrales bacterium]
MIGFLSGSFVNEQIHGRGAGRPPGQRPQPDCVVLAPRAGSAPSQREPVRIFVGTEPGQYRAERVFVHSVDRTRDPARRYEIYLMRDLVGFDRARWLTGFTNYRFAIPHFAGNRGRAIYNDVDQIYLGDPAELFDMEMDGAGFLALSDKDTAVMLIDCERMAPIWRIEDARKERRKALEARSRSAGVWGPLPRQWHCRDEEYRAGWSKVLHYTTIHEQPWQPFPRVFAYQPNAVGYVWHDMEREARRIGAHVFTRERPSPRFQALAAHAAAGDVPMPVTTSPVGDAVPDVIAASSAKTALEVGWRRDGVCGADLAAVVGDAQRCAYASVLDLASTALALRCDAVVCRRGLEQLPSEDVPWVIEELFERAGRVVHIEVDASSHALRAAAVHEGPRGESWWDEVVTEAAARHPHVRWQLAVQGGPARLVVRRGGPRPDGKPPAVWILADHKLGHTTQSVGLASALGWPYEIKRLAFNALQKLDNRLLGAKLLSLDARRSDPLTPPWPDLVIATGRTVAPIARWIGEQSGGRSRIVQMGRRGALARADAFDLSVVCGFFGYPVHPRRFETLAPLTAIDDAVLTSAGQRWRDLFADMPRPHVALLVGGSSAAHRLDGPTAARMAAQVAEKARDAGGSLYIVTSPRTGEAATAALRQAVARIGEHARLYEWKRGDDGNPYMGCLAVADVLVVTADSESMLAEAAATDRPLYIYPVPTVEGGWQRRMRGRIVQRASARPRKAKGTVRPQQGLEYVCARMIERGIVRPPRNIAELHRRLVAEGHARFFGEALDLTRRVPLRELAAVAERVRALLGVPPAGHSS